MNFIKSLLRDIRDKSFPELGNWIKSETFNLTKDGIEFFDPLNVLGFELYIDDNYYWDVIHNKDRVKSKKYSKSERAHCIDFLPFEEILNVDWEHDDYFGCITIFCQFKYKKNGVRHPFKEFRYYILENRFLTLLEESKRRNFKPIIPRIKEKLIKPFRRFKRYLKYRKYYR